MGSKFAVMFPDKSAETYQDNNVKMFPDKFVSRNVLMVGGAKSATINTLQSLTQQSTKCGHYYLDESNQLNNKFLLLVFGDGMIFMEYLYLYSFESTCAVSNYSLPR